MAKIRPLTDAEQRAAELMRANRDVGAVAKLTGLSRAQVAAAVDLAKQWDAVFARMNGDAPAVAAGDRAEAAPEAAGITDEAEAGTEVQPEDEVDGPEPDFDEPDEPDAKQPGPDPTVVWTDITAEVIEPIESVRGRLYEDDGDPAAEPTEAADVDREEPAPDGDIPGTDDYAALLERAMLSHSPRAHDLARSVYRTIDEITALLEREDLVEPLRVEIERLEAELAQKRTALAAIYDAGSVPEVPTQPTVNGAGGIDPSLFFARGVREWARSQNLDVRPQGRIATTVVEAYVAAHQPAAV